MGVIQDTLECGCRMTMDIETEMGCINYCNRHKGNTEIKITDDFSRAQDTYTIRQITIPLNGIPEYVPPITLTRRGLLELYMKIQETIFDVSRLK